MDSLNTSTNGIESPGDFAEGIALIAEEDGTADLAEDLAALVAAVAAGTASPDDRWEAVEWISSPLSYPELWEGQHAAIKALEGALRAPTAVALPEPCPSGSVCGPAWRENLHRLEGLPLLPCGAGTEKKAPINPDNGLLLKGWEKAAFSPAQIFCMNSCVRSVGTRTGAAANGLLAFDLDGATAISRAAAAGCNPDRAKTWQILRTTDPNRLKVLFKVPPELWQQLGEVHKSITTKEKSATAKGEQVEVFFGSGQIILAGEHVPSGGFYAWKNGPDDLAEIPPEWWALALEVIGFIPAPPAPDRAGMVLDDGIRGSAISDSDKARACLAVLDVGQYRKHDDWVKVGMMLHSVGDDSLLDEWDRWSAGDPASYEPGLCATKWRSFKATGSKKGAATIGSLIKAAGLSFAKAPTASAERLAQHQEQLQPASSKRADGEAKRGKRTLGHRRAMRCFERSVDHLAARERNSLRRRVQLLAIAKALGLTQINRQEITEMVLRAKDRQQGRGFKALTAADRLTMERPRVTWLLPGMVPEGDLTIIGGRPKVGKTRLAMVLVAAVRKQSRPIDFDAPPQRPVVLITDDQGDGDTADMLEAHGLWSDPGIVWSRHFRLTEDDIDDALDTIHQHPGALVVMDSLRSITRSLQFGENDPEIGAVLYDLKDAVVEAGGTLLMIHHNNKTADLVGVEALSGHSAISGAANAVLTLHHLPDGKGRPLKEEPQRRLVRAGRSGMDFDLVISPLAHGGAYYRVGTFSDWQQRQRKDAEEEKDIGRMPQQQTEALRVLKAHGGWMTRRQVSDALGVVWEEEQKSKPVWNALHALKNKGFVDSGPREGREATYRIHSHGAQQEECLETLERSSDSKGFDDDNVSETWNPEPAPAEKGGDPPGMFPNFPNAWNP